MMIVTVIRKSTGEEFKTSNVLERDFNKMLQYNGFDARKGLTFQADEEDFSKLERILISTNWQEQPATDSQVSYLVRLGVSIRGRQLTKSLASQLIDAVKTGQGVGHLGFTMRDGSN